MAKKEQANGILRRKGRKAAGRKGLPTGSAEIAAAALLGTLVASEVDANLKNYADENAAAQPQGQDAGSRPERDDVTAQQSREQSDLDARRELLRDQQRGLPDETAASGEAPSEQTAGAATEGDLAALEGMDQPGAAAADLEQVVEGATGEEPVRLAQASGDGTATDAAPAGAQGATQGDPASAETGGAMSPGAPNAAMVAAGLVGVIGITAIAASGGGGGVAAAVVGGGPVIAAGVVVDGKVAGATVFADLNGNGVRDPGEPMTSSGPDGRFNLGELAPGTKIVSDGGTDLFTGKPAGRLTSTVDPDGNTAVNPLTSLMAAGVTAAQLQQLGITLPGGDPRDVDVDDMLRSPDAAVRQQGEDLFTAQFQLQTIINAAVALRLRETGGTREEAFAAVTAALAAEFAAGGDPNTLGTRLTARALSVTGADAAETASAAAAINNVVQEIEERFNDLDSTYGTPGDDDAQAAAILAQTSLIEAIEDNNSDGLATLANDDSLNQLVEIVADELTGGPQERTISDSEAQALLDAGIAFSPSDDITVQAEGTNLNVSLKDLSRLGADRVIGENLDNGDNPDLVVQLGEGDFPNSLPEFQNGLQVNLVVDADQIGEVINNADDLSTTVAEGDAGRFDAGIDSIDVVENVLSLTETQALTLVNEGLDFVAGDDITVAADGTQMQTSLKDLADLGADHVATDQAAAAAQPGRDVVLGLGIEVEDNPAGHDAIMQILEQFGSDVFADGSVVQLNVPDQDTFNAIMHNNDIVDKLVDMGVDVVQVLGQPNIEDDLHS